MSSIPPGRPPGAPVAGPPRRGLEPWKLVLIIVGSCAVGGLFVLAVLGALFFPVLAQARSAARTATCRSRIRDLSRALLLYAADHQERFPPPAAWQDGTARYHSAPDAFACPSAPGVLPGYAFNRLLGGRRRSAVADPASVPLLFESSLGVPGAADRLQSFAARHPARGGPGRAGWVVYVDGSQEALSRPPSAAVPAR